jgi:hypothetical protein
MIDLRHAEWNKSGTPCVSVVESPSSQDLLLECQEGRALQTALYQARIPSRYYLATNKNTFTSALQFIAQQRHSAPQPIALHVSCHGNEDGITLTDEDFVAWDELRRILLGFAREAMAYHEAGKISSILLCMSACSGLAAQKMAENEECPFMSLVAPSREVLWSDCLTSFLVFYNLFLIKNAALDEAVSAMNVAAGIEDLFQTVDLSEHLRRAVSAGDTDNT